MTETIEQLKNRAAELLQSPRRTNEHIDAINDIASQLRVLDVPLSAELSAQALQLTARNDYRHGRATALLGLGWCQLAVDQYKEAERGLEESCQVFLDLRDDARLASAINHLGTAKRYLGDYEAALDSHRSALRLREKLNDSNGVASILLNFSAIYWRLSDYAQSLEYCYRGLQNATEGGAFILQAHARYGLGDLLWRVGDAAAAIECSEQALALLQENPDRRGESMALSNLGAAHHSLGDYEEALDNYRRALTNAQAAGNIETQVEVAIRMGSMYCETNDVELGITHLSEALQLSQSIRSQFYESQALLQLGTAYRQVGNDSESVQMLEQSLEISQELNIKETRYKANLALSEIYEKQGKMAAALHYYQSFHRVWQDVHGIQATRRVQQLLLQNKFEQTPNEQQFLPRVITDGNRILKSEKQSQLSGRKLREVIEFVNHHLEENISVADLAGVAAFSQRHFQDLFKQTTGKTPHQFLVQQRLERAKQLLQTTQLPLVEIAARSGFSSQSHLAAQFRLATGTSLNQFRRLQNKPQKS